MAKRRKYHIDGTTYPTQKAVVDKVRSIIASHLNDDDDLTPAEFSFVRSLLDSHPDATRKIGCGVKAIWVADNPKHPGAKNRGFWLRRTDGSVTDFSFWECIRPSSQRAKALAACRSAIIQQVTEFKEQAFELRDEVACAVTGEGVGRSNCHVDHAEPKTFDILFDDWLLHAGLDVEDIKLSGRGDWVIGDEMADAAQRSSWREFHRDEARLRIVKESVNLSELRRGRRSSQTG